MRLIVLVGPKGSGKTTLGRMLEDHRDVLFFEVEAVARRVRAEHDGPIDERYARHVFSEIVSAVAALDHDTVVIETTGASEETPAFLAALRERFDVELVRVRASRRTCEARIAARDSTRQVDVPAELVAEMHRRTEALDLPWDADVDNDTELSSVELLAAVDPLLRHESER